MKNKNLDICETCLFFHREHLLDAFLHHTVVYECLQTKEKVFPQHGACRYYFKKANAAEGKEA